MCFAVGVLEELPRTQKGKVVTHQLAKAATSVEANDRAACRGRSRAEYLSKLQIVLEESDESHFWFELILRADLVPNRSKATALRQEANELTAIFNSALYRARKPDS